MQFDFSYIDCFFAVLDKGHGISEIASTIGYKTIQKHVELTGSEFNLLNIEDAINGNNNAGYGLRDLTLNINKIRDLSQKLRGRTEEWQAIVKKGVLSIFSEYDFTNTIICPVVGYDIGIGIDDVVCINLNSGLFFNDIKEVFSISIHETTHTVTKNLLGLFFSFNTKQDLLKTLNCLIPYEGIGIFSAYHYRLENQLPNIGVPPLEDYNVSHKSYELLLKTYKELILLNNDDKVTLDEMLNKAFSGIRLTHRLGYAIVAREYQQYGIDKVREIARMKYSDFVKKYLV